MTILEFKNLTKLEMAKLVKLGFNEILENRYKLEFITNARILGLCTKTDVNRYTIALNKEYANSEDINLVIQTIMHELIHSLKNCMSHTKRWKTIANIINNQYSYNITRTTRAINYSQSTAKYKIVCSGCGNTSYYYRKCNIVKQPENYSCNHCHANGIQHKLEVYLNE